MGRRWCVPSSSETGVKVFGWINIILEMCGVLVFGLILGINLTLRINCVTTKCQETLESDPYSWYSNPIKEVQCPDTGITTIGAGSIIIHLIPLGMTTLLFVGIEQRNIFKCTFWIRLTGVLILLEFIFFICYIQLEKSICVILYTVVNCTSKCYGIRLVYAFICDTIGYADIVPRDRQLNSAISENTRLVSLMEYNENIAKANLRWM